MKFVDADVFLYWTTDHAKHGRRATEILRHIELNEKAITSTFTLHLFDKVMDRTEGYSFSAFIDRVEKIRNLKVVELEKDHLLDAAAARQKFNVATDVAISYAVARDRGANAIYSSNLDFDRTDLRRDF